MLLKILLLALTLFVDVSPEETCHILQHFFPHSADKPYFPKNEICRQRAYPHCCSTSVEQAMFRYANVDAMSLLFGTVRRMRDISKQQFTILQEVKLPYLEADMRSVILQYQLEEEVSGITPNTSQITEHYLSMFYDVKTIPQYCKERVVDNLAVHVHSFIKDVILVHKLVSKSWSVAGEIFELVLNTPLSYTCTTALMEAGLTRLSCKTCTDESVRVPTCFNYCEDIISSCLAPYSSIVELLYQWINHNVKAQAIISTRIGKKVYDNIKTELYNILDIEMNDEFYRDVCEFHFSKQLETHPQKDPNNSNQDPNNSNQDPTPVPKRSKRIAKNTDTPAPTVMYSTRFVSYPPSSSHPIQPIIKNNELFNSQMICYNTTKIIINNDCWNGTGSGNYDQTKKRLAKSQSYDLFREHLPRLKKKMKELEYFIAYGNEKESVPFAVTRDDVYDVVESGGCSVYVQFMVLIIALVLLV